MKFINGRLIDVGYKANAHLILSYAGKLKPQINISIELKEGDIFILNLTYHIVILTEIDDLLNKYSGEYNFEIERDGETIDKDSEIIYKHVQYGLIYALNRIGGNNTAFASSALNTKDLHPSTTTILNALIQSGFYSL